MSFSSDCNNVVPKTLPWEEYVSPRDLQLMRLTVQAPLQLVQKPMQPETDNNDAVLSTFPSYGLINISNLSCATPVDDFDEDFLEEASSNNNDIKLSQIQKQVTSNKNSSKTVVSFNICTCVSSYSISPFML